MKTTVNERIKELRIELGLNQTQFAVGCELSLPQISRIENNLDFEVSEKTLKQIRKAYNVNPEWLKSGKQPMLLEVKREPIEAPNPWKEALISEMKEEITYLRGALMSALGNNPNFREAIELLRVA
jgi:transcriptional regulator with XRE-family HTH domain